MSETTTMESPAVQIAADAPAQAQPRGEGGRFGPKEPVAKVQTIEEAQADTMEGMRDALRESFGVKSHPEESDRAALDGVRPKGKDPKAKTDPDKGDKPTGTTAQAKPEPSSKDATRPAEMAKARKALELEGWSEEDLADIPDERIVALGKKAGEKHARIAREKREAAEAAKKTSTVDPGKTGTTAKEPATSEDTDDDAEYLKAAEEIFQGLTAETDEGTKRFLNSQAKFAKKTVQMGLSKEIAKLKTEHAEALQNLERGLRGEARLERALDRVAVDVPQVEDTAVRPKVVARVLSLMTGEETREEFENDLPGAIREACRAMGLKDEGEARRQSEAAELRAAKESGQPFTGHRGDAPEAELDGMELITDSIRTAYKTKRH